MFKPAEQKKAILWATTFIKDKAIDLPEEEFNKVLPHLDVLGSLVETIDMVESVRKFFMDKGLIPRDRK